MNECTGVNDLDTSCNAPSDLPNFVMTPGASYPIGVAKDGSSKVSVDKDSKLVVYPTVEKGDSTSTSKNLSDSTGAVVETMRTSDDPRTQPSTKLDQSQLDQWYRTQSANYKQSNAKPVVSKKEGFNWNALLTALIYGPQIRSGASSTEPYWYYPARSSLNPYSDDSLQRSYLSRMSLSSYGYPPSERTLYESYPSSRIRREPLIIFADTPSAPALNTPRTYTPRGPTIGDY